MKRLIVIHVFAVLLLACSSCTIFQRGTGYISDYIPRDSDVPGWNRQSTPSTADGESIGSYRNDYTGLGIDSIAWCSFTSFEDRDRFIEVEVIRFKNITDSYSFYSDSAGFSESGTCPDDEFYNDTKAVIRAGEYIVHVKTSSQHLENSADLKSFSSISRNYIGDRYSPESLPALQGVLKRAGATCVLFSKRGIAAVPGINRCYYSMINDQNKNYFVFLSERGTYYDSLNLFQKIISKKYIIIKADNTQSAFIRDEKGVYTFVSIYDRWIYGCWSVSDINDGKTILQNIRNAVESYSRAGR